LQTEEPHRRRLHSSVGAHPRPAGRPSFVSLPDSAGGFGAHRDHCRRAGRAGRQTGVFQVGFRTIVRQLGSRVAKIRSTVWTARFAVRMQAHVSRSARTLRATQGIAQHRWRSARCNSCSNARQIFSSFPARRPSRNLRENVTGAALNLPDDALAELNSVATRHVSP